MKEPQTSVFMHWLRMGKFREGLTLIFCFLTLSISTQITIGPEAGFYYRPYLFRVISIGVRQKNIDFSFGIMGEVNLGSGLFAQSRIAYVLRSESYSGSVRTYPSNLKDVTLSNKEMTLNLDVLYEPVKNSKVGLGLGMIHKLNAQVQENFYHTDSQIKYYSPGAYYNMSVVFNQNWGRFGFTARYFYMFTSENIDSNNSRVMDDKSGFTLGFNYKLLGYTKK